KAENVLAGCFAFQNCDRVGENPPERPNLFPDSRSLAIRQTDRNQASRGRLRHCSRAPIPASPTAPGATEGEHCRARGVGNLKSIDQKRAIAHTERVKWHIVKRAMRYDDEPAASDHLFQGSNQFAVKTEQFSVDRAPKGFEVAANIVRAVAEFLNLKSKPGKHLFGPPPGSDAPVNLQALASHDEGRHSVALDKILDGSLASRERTAKLASGNGPRVLHAGKSQVLAFEAAEEACYLSLPPPHRGTVQAGSALLSGIILFGRLRRIPVQVFNKGREPDADV